MLPDPRIVPYISSNEPFPSSLGVHLQTYLDSLGQRLGECDSKLAALEQEFQRIRHTLQAARSQRNRLSELRHRYQHVTAAVRRLPPEVIALVLRYALSSPDGVSGGGGRALGTADREYFAGLRSVCRLWRTTAFTTPDLWRYLSITLQFSFGFGASASHLANRLKGWFSRGGDDAEVMLIVSSTENARTRPKDVLVCLDQPGLNFGTISLGSVNDQRDHILSLLKPITSFQRTRNASISAGYTGSNDPQWTPLSSVFPRLQSLALHFKFPFHVVLPHSHLICLHLNNNPFHGLYELASL
jgi:F-box-like